MARKPTLTETIAARLRGELDSFGGTRLPGIRELAKRYGVSYVTMVRACGILKDEGVLRGRRGAGLERVVDGKRAEAPRETLTPRARSVDVVCERIAADIASGRLRAGDRLPKVLFYVKEHAVSNHTVLEAYRTLEKRELIRRGGKSWIVGTAEASRPPRFGGSPPVVVLLEPRRLFWQRQIHRSRTERFAATFMEEAERWGVQVLSLPAAAPVGERGIATMDRGGIASFVANLGKRYLGTLVPFGSRDGEKPADWIREMLRFGKPVVWFDRHDERRMEGFSRHLFTRCHYRERNAIALAIRHLYESGHREVGYVYHDATSPWRRQRLDDLRTEARSFTAMTVHGFTQPAGFFANLFDERFAAFLTSLRCRSLPAVDQALQSLAAMLPKVEHWARLPRTPPGSEEPARLDDWQRCIDELPPLLPTPRKPPPFVRDAVTVLRSIRHTRIYHQFGELTSALNMAPALMKALSNPRITTLILPNDLDARYVFRWIQRSGLRVPERISLLSFDNAKSLSGFPVTTIDFGFAHLGYSTLHLFLQDVPVRRNRHGEVATTPRLVRRGSIRRIPKT
jgi:DNA-binding LacI/PurR family transcriptional regulator/DNA-binding transcriptional regulator YhcF (GntR family)